MKTPNIFLKTATILSSIEMNPMNGNYLLRAGAVVLSLLLLGGFVAYRAGYFDGTSKRRDDTKPSTPAMMSDSKTGIVSNPQLQGLP